MRTFYLLSLGCAKNTVDSASMAFLLSKEGYKQVATPSRSEVIIVNTCGFIADSRDESIRELSKLARQKKKHQILIAAGCLSQRYGEQLLRQVPGIDGILGTRRWMDIVDIVSQRPESQKQSSLEIINAFSYPNFPKCVPQHAKQGGSAYLKISDGCRHECSFCAIPSIKGTARSRPVNAILEDAEQLQALGVQELVLIAQDTTDYGNDLGLTNGLSSLLEKLVTVCPEIPWIRIMYAYPGLITPKLIDCMAKHRQILPYIDLPLQHANPEILRSMKRPYDIDWVYKTIAKLRTLIPQIAIRSTFIVGYPGETESQYTELLSFLQDVKLDRAGAFCFSFEEGTPSASLGDPIEPEVKQERLDRLMETQRPISLALNQKWVSSTMDVLVEGSQSGFIVGRTFRDAPEIDGLVIAEGNRPTGTICKVNITGAMDYDLSGFVKI